MAAVYRHFAGTAPQKIFGGYLRRWRPVMTEKWPELELGPACILKSPRYASTHGASSDIARALDDQDPDEDTRR